MTRIQRISHWISLVFNPLFVAPVFFLIMLLADPSLSVSNKWLLSLIVLTFSSFIPLGFLLILQSKGKIHTIEIDRREKRVTPLLLGVLHFIIGYFILRFLKAPPLVSGLMFCYATNTFIVVLITLYWKISLHAIGVSGPFAALVFQCGWQVWPLGLIIPLVGISRIILKKHTIMQVIAGTMIGLLSTGLQIYLFFT